MAQIREYKSSVFSMLLENQKNCLQVYNALNNTSHEDPDLVEIKRLDGGILLSIRNDASFLIDNRLNLYEHQSTYNPNMPLRSLIYFTELIREHITNDDLFKRQKITIPVPHFVVFYNGIENRPEKENMFLSSSYAHDVCEPELELKCTVYNINQGNNQILLNKCPVLNEYMIFVDKVRTFMKIYKDIETAIDMAVEECIAGHVLEDFLLEKGNEVKQVAALDYTFERREKLFRAEEREQGRKEGLAEGLAEGHAEGLAEGITQGELLARIKIICVKLQKSQTIEQISDALEENPKIIEKIVTIANEYAPNYDVEEITKRYMNL